MGQFLPEIKNVFGEIEKYRGQLEREVALEEDSNNKDAGSRSHQLEKEYSSEN